MEEDVEVIFESWLFKFQDVSGRKKFRLSSGWKKRYFILLHQDSKAYLWHYDKKPRSIAEKPRGKIALYPSYKVEKRFNLHDKPLVCEVTVANLQLLLAAEDEKLHYLLTFFLQSQCQLREELEGQCFVVRPDTSEDLQKIGAKGNMCLLHVSKSGIILALQLSKCILAIWPLRAVKFYESSGRGQFAVETGRRAPTGPGKYSFNTRIGQDILLYDALERHVAEAAGLSEMVSARISNPPEMDTMSIQYSNLQQLVVAHSDSRFLAHLKKISRTIYDQLAEHLGGTTTKLNASSPDLLSSSTHLNDSAMPRFASSQAVNITPANTAQRKAGKKPPYATQPLSTSAASGASGVSALTIDSQYLHMSSPESVAGPRSSGGSAVAERYVDGVPLDDNYRMAGAISGERRVSEISTVSTLTEEYEATLARTAQRQRLQSRSCEDLTDYTRMALDGVTLNSYNEIFKLSDEKIDSQPSGSPGLYSYAVPADEWASASASASFTSASYVAGRQDLGPGSSLPRPALSGKGTKAAGASQAPAVMYNRSYAGRPGRLRKSMSNPDLLERELKMFPQPKSRRPTYLDLPTPPPVPKPPTLKRLDQKQMLKLDFSVLPRKNYAAQPLKRNDNWNSNDPDGGHMSRRSISPVSNNSGQSYGESSTSAESGPSSASQLMPATASMMKGVTFSANTKSFVRSPLGGPPVEPRHATPEASTPKLTRQKATTTSPVGYQSSAEPRQQGKGFSSTPGGNKAVSPVGGQVERGQLIWHSSPAGPPSSSNNSKLPMTSAKPPMTSAKPPMTSAKPPMTSAKPPMLIPRSSNHPQATATTQRLVTSDASGVLETLC